VVEKKCGAVAVFQPSEMKSTFRMWAPVACSFEIEVSSGDERRYEPYATWLWKRSRFASPRPMPQVAPMITMLSQREKARVA
jgi:hypothetical protein